MNDAAQILRDDMAREDNFVLRLRSDLAWDGAAFTRLERAMWSVCEEYEDADRLERDLAEYFYVAAVWVPDWTSHPDFPRPEPGSYYRDCLERLGLLADWFFTGGRPYPAGHVPPAL